MSEEPKKLEEKKFGFEDIPEEVLIKIEENRKSLGLDLLKQIALLEIGFSFYKDEQELARAMGITQKKLQSIKRIRADDIVRFKQQHMGAADGIVGIVGKRASYIALMERAILEGDSVMADKMKSVLTSVETIAPMKGLKDAAEILDILKVDKSPSSVHQTNVQVNMNSAIADGEAALRARKAAKREKKAQGTIIEGEVISGTNPENPV